MSGETRCLPGENVLYPVIKRKYDRSVQLRYNYRLYPSPGQRAAMARAFECARVVFNDALRLRQDAYAAGLPYVTDAEVSARLTAAKKTPERAWPGEVSAVVLQQALADLNTAYRNFFALGETQPENRGPGEPTERRHIFVQTVRGLADSGPLADYGPLTEVSGGLRAAPVHRGNVERLARRPPVSLMVLGAIGQRIRTKLALGISCLLARSLARPSSGRPGTKPS